MSYTVMHIPSEASPLGQRGVAHGLDTGFLQLGMRLLQLMMSAG